MEMKIEESRVLLEEKELLEWKKKKIKLMIVSVLLLLVLGAAVLCYALVLRVKDVTAQSTLSYSGADIIVAAGIPSGEFLYATSDAEIEANIRAACPKIVRVEIERQWPDTIYLKAVETIPVYYTEMGGSLWILSSDFQVMGRLSDEQEKDSLICLVLPEIKKVVAGSKIQFIDEKAGEKSHVMALAVLESELGKQNRISKAYLNSEKENVLICDGKYRMILGTEEDVDVKLIIADKVLQNAVFTSGSKAVIDLTQTSQTSVTLDANADVS